jgi:hypothetical protein
MIPGSTRSEDQKNDGCSNSIRRCQRIARATLSGIQENLGTTATDDAPWYVVPADNRCDVVYQKDLGPKTAAIAAGISEYNRDATWSKVTD